MNTKILIAGDLRPNKPVIERFNNNNYQIFKEVKEVIAQVDYSLVNLESPIVIRKASPIKKTGPNIKCEENVISALQYAGFNCVTLANNHFYDYGEIGVEDTIDSCKKSGLDYVGGGLNLEEAQQILYKRINNKKIAFINRCENEWSIATNNRGGAAKIDTIDMFYTIQEAKANADYVILILHGGIEQYQLPTPQMKKAYRYFVDLGADAVINHHQHCYSGYEIYNGKPIFYGLGNFCFYSSKADKLWEEGYMVVLEITDSISFTIHPFIQCKDDSFAIDLNNINKDDFKKSIIKLNNIIENDELLESNYDILVAKKKQMYLDYIEPHSSKILYALQHRKILPSFLKERKKRYLLNISRCESHRDILLKILNI